MRKSDAWRQWYADNSSVFPVNTVNTVTTYLPLGGAGGGGGSVQPVAEDEIAWLRRRVREVMWEPAA